MRRFLNSVILLAVGSGIASQAVASMVASGEQAASSLIKRVVEGPQGAYFVYPHSNGFLADGRLVLSQQDGKLTHFFLFDPASGSVTPGGTLPNVRLYGGISPGGLLVTTVNNCVVVMDLMRGEISSRLLYEAPRPWRMGMPGFSPDGNVYMDFHIYAPPARNEMRLLRVDGDNSNGGEVVLKKDWLLNHVHRSEIDPGWILFSHEGRGVTDRMWAWHASLAPEGRPVFEQKDAGGQVFYVGHELLMHHKLAALAVVFGSSPGKPRGLYEIDIAGAAAGHESTARLVSEGLRDWHCNISRDGRWAVVDTMGASDEAGGPPAGWSKDGGVSDVVAVDIRTGARRFLCRTSLLNSHPWHPHPHISPDNRWVICNDANSRRIFALETDQDALDAFLR
ncbi:MAG: hypothetical protein LBK99_11915 [Opitutaceae bacterium]|jgi:hypothetical protein|nr:hypothetical protein [Opitutaceae bacterium]